MIHPQGVKIASYKEFELIQQSTGVKCVSQTTVNPRYG